MPCGSQDEVSLDPLDPKTHVVQASVRFSQPATSSASNAKNSASAQNRSSTPNPGAQNGAAAGGGGKSGQEERERALNALEGIKRALKGLVDLKRME